jgi:hypothetical protein
MTTTSAVSANLPQADNRISVGGMFTTREWVYVGIVILVTLAITSVPFIYAYKSAPDNMQFMGVMVNPDDHFQYFSWMRESQTHILVSNQLTPEYSTPLLFNFLWWTLGRVQSVTGWTYDAMFQIARLLAGAFVIAATYFFCGIIFSNRAKRWTAFAIAVFGGGLGWIWVVEKTLANLPEVSWPFDLYASEPNTFFNILAFPHFAIAAGLIAVVFSFVLLGQRSKQMRYAWYAALTSLLLSAQHSYDMFIIYPVIGLYALFIWTRDRKFPMYLFKLGVIVVLFSVWPALQAFYITNADDVWRGVLSQFDNAGAWTPNPLHLIVLMGIPLLLAIWALDIKTPWRDRDDTHLFILAWFLSHFVLVYIPLNFQIHLLSGWQVVTGVLATIGLYRRVLPWLGKRFSKVSRQRLALIATVVLILLVIPVNLYLLGWRLIDLRRAEVPYFLPKTELTSLDYLETQVTSDDVVLASLDIGRVVPALTGARAFLGHWAQTLDFYGKRDMVTAFFNSATSDAERQDILRQYSVDYVFYGTEEVKLGDYDPSEAPYLTELFEDNGTKVFKVNSEVETG